MDLCVITCISETELSRNLTPIPFNVEFTPLFVQATPVFNTRKNWIGREGLFQSCCQINLGLPGSHHHFRCGISKEALVYLQAIGTSALPVAKLPVVVEK